MARSGRGTITRATYRPIPRVAFYIQLLTASLSAAGINVKSVNKTISGSMTSSSTFVRYLTAIKLFEGLFTPDGSIVKDISTSRSGTISSSATLDDILVLTLLITGAVTGVAGAIDFTPSKYLTAQLDTSSNLIRASSLQVASNIVSAGLVSQFSNIALNGYFLPEGTVDTTLSAFRSLASTVAPSSVVRRRSVKVLTSNVNAAGVTRNSVSRLLSGAIATVGAFVKQRVGDINAVSASITIETIVSITLVYEDKSVILSVDGI